MRGQRGGSANVALKSSRLDTVNAERSDCMARYLRLLAIVSCAGLVWAARVEAASFPLLDGNRQASERRIQQRTRTLIIPIIEKLQRERNMEKYRVELELLLNYVENLTADLASDLKIAAALSATELRIASLIKNGMSSEEIARHENVSIYTVKTHRKNIRRKLKLKNSGINLRAYLESEDYKT